MVLVLLSQLTPSRLLSLNSRLLSLILMSLLKPLDPRRRQSKPMYVLFPSPHPFRQENMSSQIIEIKEEQILTEKDLAALETDSAFGGDTNS